MRLTKAQSRNEQTALTGPARVFFTKVFRAGGCLLILLCAGGCGGELDFEAETIVSPDSVVTRKTRFTTNSIGLKDELQTRYTLPAEGKWESGQRPKRSSAGKEHEATSTYEVGKQYTPGSPIASDYVRKAEFSKQVSRNEPRLTVRNYVFVKTFDYEERFRDIVTQNFEKTARRIYKQVIEHEADYLVQEREDGLTAPQANAAIASAFDPLLEKFLHTVRSKGIRATGDALEEGQTLEELLEPEQVAARVIEVLPPATGRDSESWRKAIAEAYKRAVEAAWKDPAFEDEIFGVYGLGLLGPTYSFTVALSLPGELLESNATKQEGKRLVWVFESADFRWKDQILRARSRLVYPERIAIAGAVLLAIIAGWWFSRLRTRRNRTAQKNGLV